MVVSAGVQNSAKTPKSRNLQMSPDVYSTSTTCTCLLVIHTRSHTGSGRNLGDEPVQPQNMSLNKLERLSNS